MIPLPNLDDRTWADIVEEAVSMIPKYCPDWTNHNASDPGITLIELFPWMMEMTIYRLNKVTDKHYLAFLDLVGLELKPPSPAYVDLTFSLVPGAKNFQVIPAGTTVVTDYAGDEKPLSYETQEDLVVLPTSIARVYSQYHDIFADNTSYIHGRPGQDFELFMGCERIERYIYLMDVALEKLTEEALLILNFETPESPDTDFASLCDWEYWNGHRWRSFDISNQEQPIGHIAFIGDSSLQSTEVAEVTGTWIRGRLANIPASESMTLVEKIGMRIEVLGEGIQPDSSLVLDGGETYLPLDVSKVFHPFTKEPRLETAFYLSCSDFFGIVGARIHIDVDLSDNAQLNGLNPSDDLSLSWEFWDGKQWVSMANTTKDGVNQALRGADFEDSSYSFTRNGTISFTVLEQTKMTEISDEESFWIRARLVSGDYGVAGTYVLNGDKWSWLDERPLRPPQLKSIHIRYEEAAHCPQRILTYNDFRYEDITASIEQDLRQVQVFEPIPEESPALYIGLNGPFPNEQIMAYFKVANDNRREKSQEINEHFRSYYKQMLEEYHGEIRLAWEYWDGRAWTDLGVEDGTHSFTESGYIKFLGPKQMAPTRKFGAKLFWLRVRMEMGGYEQLPRVSHILFNTVPALNRKTLRFEILGSGNATPNEELFFINSPVLEGEEIWVREKEEPSQQELEYLRTIYKDKPFLEEDRRGDGIWVRWQNVESFYASGPQSRHYQLDRLTGRVRFGDGKHGMVLPKLDQNVRTTRYCVGGGVRGNIGSNQATTLRQAIAYIDGVTNHYPAKGGSDVESLEELKQRAPHVIKSGYRAVTKDDFEALTLQSSSSIARAHCLPSTQSEGEVTVILIPKFDEKKSNYSQRLIPSKELIRRVKAFLDLRRLITVKVHVEPPKYREISVSLEVIRKSTGASERLKKDIEFSLRKFLHPLHGGRDGQGWQFGRSVYKVDLYHTVEQISGVDFVDNIVIYDEDSGANVEQVKLDAKGLPYLVNIDITEKARQMVV